MPISKNAENVSPSPCWRSGPGRDFPETVTHWPHEPKRCPFAKTRQPFLPLPGGEGRGEGERKTNSSKSFHPHWDALLSPFDSAGSYWGRSSHQPFCAFQESHHTIFCSSLKSEIV